MLYLIGVGLSNYDVTMEGLEACRRCKQLYAEAYTSNLTEEKLKDLSKILEKEIDQLGRTDLEENAKILINQAAKEDIGLLINGDPLIATTHKTLLMEASASGVGTKVIHSTSILSVSMGESGLDFYRIGPVCTIANWSEHYHPISFYETIKGNMDHNLHSIMLLDYDYERQSTMPIEKVAFILSEAEEHYKKKIISEDTKFLVLNNIGTENGKIKLYTFAKLKTAKIKGMNTIILLAKLSNLEEEWISKIEKA
ncbi:aEF-2-diphthine synthase (DPH5) [Candidatus Mancarchaeum acidiphilum]|uniref:AEF-2-diphthine synthase (DPH5) n=1 Tax=Candidatus Mancarchaeum acidiphilum TaxID=1920749 RepID=A0A218NLL6_9ARCH|nr:diphthine synthase [Candidatus Mancarchaeum acidiphilum]ASI13351.1 aEF-2-diphthine synthase (DPH5) [Candidatus Mancarchaeum acidiphilum]